MFSSVSKDEAKDVAEIKPLLEEGFVEIEEEEPAPWDITQLVYEPVTKHYQCELNPTPLRLLLVNFGIGFAEIMSILGAYMFLNTHMNTMFPKCDAYPIIDRLLGTNIGHGVLCEICSLFLWTFPLMCCLMVPWFHYWEFVDSRLYYECLRQKILVKFAPREFFVSPLIWFLFGYIVMGILSLVFAVPDSYAEWKMKLVVVVTFLFPVVSFIATVYMKWDIKYNLLTLANFVDLNTPWAREHLHHCRGVTEDELEDIFLAMQSKLETLKTKSSANVFHMLYIELKRRRDLQQAQSTPRTVSNLPADHPEMGPRYAIGSEDDLSRMKFDMRTSRERIKSLLLWRKGYWLLDLLWIPQDSRAAEFRLCFRIFAAGTLFLQIATVYMGLSTVMTYLHQQGWVRGRDVRDLLWLKDLVVERLRHKFF